MEGQKVKMQFKLEHGPIFARYPVSSRSIGQTEIFGFLLHEILLHSNYIYIDFMKQMLHLKHSWEHLIKSEL